MWLLAVFVVYAERIEVALRKEVAAGKTPLGWAIVSVSPPDSVVVSWLDHEGKRHDLTF